MSIHRRDFLQIAGFTGASITGAAAVGLGARPAQAATVPTRPRILIRGGYILTMDQTLGDLRGDVLIENGKIAAVGKSLAASDAELVDASDAIVIPGFVDTHRHTWESQLRQISVDWTLFEYLKNLFGQFGVNFRPEDVYAGTLIGRLAALDGGITTMLDWSHIMNTPQHADAAIEALRDSGGRSVFAMGWPQTPDPLKWIQKSTLDVPDDIRRVRKQYFSSNTGLVSLQMAGRGPGFAVMEQVARDIGTARDLGLHTTMHVGGGDGAIVDMFKAKLLGPDITWVHLLNATDEELEAIKDSGCTTSVSPAGEEWHTPWHGAVPATTHLLNHGITTSLSPDTEAFGPGDMFSVMRETLGAARYALGNPRDPNAQPPVAPQQYNSGKIIPARKILEMATVAGAAPVEREGKIGTLTPGKQADIVLLRMSSLNYFPVNDAAAAVVMSADTSCIDAVFVAGKAVKFNGTLVNQALVKRARRLALDSRNWLYAKAGINPPDGLEKQKT
jgi:5-methylthioadenosine/S-adenosylhomocysteine deaminase